MTDFAILAGLAIGYFTTFGRRGSSGWEKVAGVVVVGLILWWLTP